MYPYDTTAGDAGGVRWFAAFWLVAATAVIAALLGAESASAARAADEVKARIASGRLAITGTPGSDKMALRLRSGAPETLQVDVGDDGSADFSFKRDRFAQILVQAGGGNDAVRIDEANGVFTDTEKTTIDGEAGEDTLLGGDGAEVLIGGTESDSVDGDRGDDVALLGAGDDTFTWNPGDGNDTLEGQEGNDAMQFNGSGAPENVDVSANGQRVRFFRNVASVTMDLDGVEEIRFAALGGPDTVTVNDMTGTALARLNADLAGTLGGEAGDGQPDAIVVMGTAANDHVQVGGVAVAGLATEVRSAHAEQANDRLLVDGLLGTDTVSKPGSEADDTVAIGPAPTPGQVRVASSAASMPLDLAGIETLIAETQGGNDSISGSIGLASLISLVLDGGPGADQIAGGDGADVILGGSENDAIDGNRGDDVALMGAGDDSFTWDPGDGSDAVEGQDGTDSLQFNGSGAPENIDMSANGQRFRLFRNVGNIVMDTDDVERIVLKALGGVDNMSVHDLSGTDVVEVDTDLAAVLNGDVGDAQIDTVTAFGTNGEDTVEILGTAGDVAVSGLPSFVRVRHAESGDNLVVNTLASDDSVSASTLPAAAIRLTVDSGDGADTIFGGFGADVLIAGDGNGDFVDGNRGDDVIFLGEGSDEAIWNPGDGSDVLEGGLGFDRLRFIGSGAPENIDLSANGGRLRLFRDVGNVVIDADDLELVDLHALAGTDTIAIHDLAATDMSTVNVDLAGTLGGTSGDGAFDRIVYDGTPGDDSMFVHSSVNGVFVTSVDVPLGIRHAESQDNLVINTLAGNDTVDTGGFDPTSMLLTVL